MCILSCCLIKELLPNKCIYNLRKRSSKVTVLDTYVTPITNDSEFQCGICKRRFSSELIYQNHLK